MGAQVMGSAFLESPGISCLTGDAYDSLLKDSIDRFIREIRRGTSDMSGFHSIFLRLLQSRADPPLEIIWFYSAANYFGNFSSTEGVLGQVFAVRDLLQLLAACSASCGGFKSIALLAPVVFELNRITIDVDKSREIYSSKELKKLKKEIYLLAEGILSYISICCGKNIDRKSAFTNLSPFFVDLVGVWTARLTNSGDSLQEFFPLVSDEVRNAFRQPGCEIRLLSGTVIAEVFLMMLRLKLQKAAAPNPELRRELKVWVVGSLTGFRSLEFFEILLMVLLEGSLPSILLLNSTDESFLRDILYDSLILVDYSFLYREMGEEDRSSVESAYVALLVVTHQAILAVRKQGDQSRVTAYINAFSRSALPSALTKLIADKLGAQKVTPRIATSPEAILELILRMEDRGYKLRKFDLSFIRGSLLPDERESNRMDDDDVFFFDNKGNPSGEEMVDDHEVEMMDGVFLSAASSMKSKPPGGRKRKGSKFHGEGRKARLVKHEADEVSGESDVEDPSSEMEDSD